MLISPPFLPDRGSMSEQDWLQAAMNGGTFGDGAFPLGQYMEWHGGIHISAPSDSTGNPLPVRAIADGKVIFLHQPTPAANLPADHPLNYGNGYTSDGIVVILHETEIGVDDLNNPTSIQFYSVYFHLFSINERVILGNPIYRKDPIGQAGHIDGQPNWLHFEICCNEENIRKIAGRYTGSLKTDQNGRKDSVFGEVYFHLPASTPIYSEAPTLHLKDATKTIPPSHHGAATSYAPLQPIAYLTEEAVVGISYSNDRDVVNGNATITTYSINGHQYGTSLQKSEAEYKLYSTALQLSNAFSAQAQPTPSAVYELLRFGRVIGPDPLTPEDFPYWHEISYPVPASANTSSSPQPDAPTETLGWVNLNASYVTKFSDADFPEWKGWHLFDDDDEGSGRCNSQSLRALIFGEARATDDTTKLTAERFNAVNRIMRRAICKFPSEWDASTFDQRFRWRNTPGSVYIDPLNQDEYQRLEKHVKALCFDCPELFKATWHFDPREFISHFRKNSWLNTRELAQCIPRSLLALDHTFVEQTTNWNSAIHQATLWQIPLNKALRRYGISNSKFRIIHIISHIIPETGCMKWVKEGGGEDRPYSPYYGRGLIQLTLLPNYKAYGKFRALTTPNVPATFHQLGWNPDIIIAENDNNYNAINCADSSGFYVTFKHGMLEHLDAGVSIDDAIAASRDVNGHVEIENLNGLDRRLQSVIYLKNILLDEYFSTESVPLTFDWRRINHKEPVLDAAGHPVTITVNGHSHVETKFYRVSHTINVSLKRQAPPPGRA